MRCSDARIYCCWGGIICIAKMVSSGNEMWYKCFSDHLLYYMMFYYGGALLRKLHLLQRLQRSDALMAASFATGITLCVVYHVASLAHPLMLITLYRMFIVVPIFVYFSKFIDKPIQHFTTLGIHSLELYVLHYFVIIGCSDYSAIWIEGIKKMPFLFQLMLCVGVTAVIATVTMLIAREWSTTMRS